MVLPATALSAFVAVFWQWLATRYSLPNTNEFISCHPLNTLQYFFIGMIIFQLWSSKTFVNPTRFTKILLDLLVLAAIVTYSMQVAFPSFLGFTAFVMAGLTAGTFTNRLFNFSPLRWAGIRCYGIYLLHQPVYLLLNHLTKERLESGSTAETIFWTLIAPALCIGLAALSFRYFESPILNWVRRRLSGHDGYTDQKIAA